MVCSGSWNRWKANQFNNLHLWLHLSQQSPALHWTHRYVCTGGCTRSRGWGLKVDGRHCLFFPEYVVTMFDTKTQELRWNATYNDYSAPPYDEKQDYSTSLHAQSVAECEYSCFARIIVTLYVTHVCNSNVTHDYPLLCILIQTLGYILHVNSWLKWSQTLPTLTCCLWFPYRNGPSCFQWWWSCCDSWQRVR